MTLQDKIRAVLQEADMQATIAAWHIESNTKIDVNGDDPYPMASTFKIPILAKAFKLHSEGNLDLDTRVPLKDEDKSRGSGILPFFQSGVEPTVRDLLTLMIIISDNTATDIMVDYLGGAAAIEGYMHELGLTDIHFKINCKQLIRTMFPEGIYDLPRDELMAWQSENDIVRDGLAFSKGSENNVSSANAMNELLHMIYTGALFDGESRQTALDILFQQQFNVRLSRFFPVTTKVAHKTGTIGGIRNDSGIIYISDTNHVILTLFCEWDEAPFWGKPEAHHQRVFEVETAMGRIGRLVYDNFNT